MKFFIVTSLLLSTLSSFAQNSGTGPGNGTGESSVCGIYSLSVSVDDSVNFKYQDAIDILRTKGYEINLESPTIEIDENGFHDRDKLGRFGKLAMNFSLNREEMQVQMQPSSDLDTEAHNYNTLAKQLEGYYTTQSVYRNSDLVKKDCKYQTYECHNGKKYSFTEHEIIKRSKKVLDLGATNGEAEEAIRNMFLKFPTCSKLRLIKTRITGKDYVIYFDSKL